MRHEEYRRRLDELLFTCGMNQRYHQCEEWRLGWWDKSVRITVAVLALAGTICAAPGVDRPPLGLIVAIVSLIVAMLLNIIPVSDREKFHAQLFQLWSELRADAAKLQLRSCDKDIEASVNYHCPERLIDLISKAAVLHAKEPFPDEMVLKECEGDEYMSLYGVRTADEARALMARRVATAPPSASGEAAAG